MPDAAKGHKVVILGGGPGGAFAALFLKQLGIESTIVEKDVFPRYHIGESFTGEVGGQLRKLGMEDILNKEEYPIKHGTKVFGSNGKNGFYVPVRDRMGPGGSQRPATTWQARRSKFDKLLLDTALERGTELLQAEATGVLSEGDRVTGVRCRAANGATVDLKSEVLIDASGQATFLASKGVIGPRGRGNYDKQVAIFSQVTGAIRDEGDCRNDTLIFYREKYYWAWFIPLDEEVVSVGIVTPSEYFTSLKMSKMDFMMREKDILNPELTWRLKDVQFVEEARGASNYSYNIERFTGKGFLCVGDAHRFVDPIFSLGLLFAAKEAQFAAKAAGDFLSGKTSNLDNPFAEYERHATGGQDIIQTMLDCFWEFPLPFQRFVHWTHNEEMVDLFAGRLYGEQVQGYDSVKRMRRLLDSKGFAQSGVAVSNINSTDGGETLMDKQPA
jgi:1H-pyrrole-2-carbonyl-[peptidyl-carrier protein] brominase